MGVRELTTGSKIYFGAPAKPMSDIMADAITQVVAQVPGIEEAYLPQCFIEGDKEARQVLVVVQNRNEIPRIAEQLVRRLQLVFPPGQFIDILPFESGAVPQGVRQSDCQIFAGKKKAWWKLW